MTIVGLIATGLIKDDRLPAGNRKTIISMSYLQSILTRNARNNVSIILNSGDPMRLIYAVDYEGRTCGYTEEVKNKPYAYYMLTGAVVCVNKCPESTGFRRNL